MTPDELENVIAELSPLQPHAEYLRSIARPSVDIRHSSTPSVSEESRYGGLPFVPEGFEWPRHAQCEYRFLGQINFEEIQRSSTSLLDSLPESGLLSLFHAHDEEGEVFWRDPGYVVAYYYPECEGFSLHDPKNDQPAKSGLSLALTPGVDLPRDREVRDDWPFDEETADCLFYVAPGLVNASSDYLLGYPSYNTMAYDPTPGPDWITLLCVRSWDELEWCWHDGDKLMVFIEADQLAQRDFSNLVCEAG